MASTRSRMSFHVKRNYMIYPTSDSDTTAVYELDESDVIWKSDQVIQFTEPNKVAPSKKKKNNMKGDRMASVASASLPVNIPDWSKILKDDYKNHGKIRDQSDYQDVDDEDDDQNHHEDEGDHRVPPHEYLARRRGASFSVHEGVGRTLKGRDLSRVRNAIWKKIGFED